MGLPFIVVGDKTDHGGVVATGSPTATAGGKAIARVLDEVICPIHDKTVITEGAGTISWHGQAVALHGCKTSCGATLIGTSTVTGTKGGGSGASSTSTITENASNSADAWAALETESAATKNQKHDEQFLLTHEDGTPAANVPYTVFYRAQNLYKHCETDADGKTERHATGGDPSSIEIYFGHVKG